MILNLSPEDLAIILGPILTAVGIGTKFTAGVIKTELQKHSLRIQTLETRCSKNHPENGTQIPENGSALSKWEVTL